MWNLLYNLTITIIFIIQFIKFFFKASSKSVHSVQRVTGVFMFKFTELNTMLLYLYDMN